MYKTLFYQDSQGIEPCKAWLDKLRKKDKIAAAKFAPG